MGRIATALQQLEPDVAALQEADGPSTWSGNFDHVATLAQLTELREHFRGEHNPFGFGRFTLSSGTALLSRQPLINPASHRFAHSWRDTKGFVVATVAVPQWNDLEIDVVSVHLDFLVPRMRRQQILHLADILAKRPRPLVLLGDLNCCWRSEPRSMDLLVSRLQLRPHAPHEGAPTFPAKWPRRRIDWILVSKDLEFAQYSTLSQAASDHLALFADLQLRNG